MKPVHEVPKRAYINVMELLVAEEVARQIKGMPPRMVKYLRQVEVETYALNRLPSLYASSEKGWQHQYEKAKRELYSQIKSAVRQALAAVQVDPIRSSEPLTLSHDDDAEAALEILRALYQQPDLGWDDATDRLRTLLANRRNSNGNTETQAATSHRTRHRADDSQAHPHYWRPGTYGGDVSWKHRQPTPGAPFDWNDPRYSK